MKAIVGLGNPGDEYSNTRHNSGFLTIDNLGVVYGATYWKDECGCRVAHVRPQKSFFGDNDFLDNDELLLACPQSFMNLSGGPVQKLVHKYNISIDDLIVAHDDLDILPGNIRVKRGGGNAGHNGLKSIDAKLSTKDYVRVRVGIGRPPGRMPVSDYVLAKPKGQDLTDWKQGIDLAVEACNFLLCHTVQETQQNYNAAR